MSALCDITNVLKDSQKCVFQHVLPATEVKPFPVSAELIDRLESKWDLHNMGPL